MWPLFLVIVFGNGKELKDQQNVTWKKYFLNEAFFCCFCKRLTLVLYWKYKISSEICQNIKKCFELDGLFLNGRMENKACFKLKVSNFLCQYLLLAVYFLLIILKYLSTNHLPIYLSLYLSTIYLSIYHLWEKNWIMTGTHADIIQAYFFQRI